MKTSEGVAFGLWLKSIEQKKNLSTSEIAKRLGVSKQTIYNWKSDPKRLKPFEIAGIIYLFDLDDDIKSLCKSFGIDQKS